MGKRSDRRKFRRRRRWAGFFLLLSLSLVAFSVMLITDMTSPDLQTTASRSVDKVGVARVASVRGNDAPEAASGEKQDKSEFLASEEEDKKTAAEKNEVDIEAGQKADKEEASRDQAAQRAKESDQKPPAIPEPPTDDLWMSIPALGLYDNYVTNTGDFSAMDYGAIKLPETGFPWQDNANTYIAAHRLGWPGTASNHQFYDLPLLAEGDVIYLGDVNGTTYTYRVTGFKEITANETWVTAPQAGRDMVSLQTCIENFGDYWTMGPNWYVRYIVQADRVSVDVAK